MALTSAIEVVKKLCQSLALIISLASWVHIILTFFNRLSYNKEFSFLGYSSGVKTLMSFKYSLISRPLISKSNSCNLTAVYVLPSPDLPPINITAGFLYINLRIIILCNTFLVISIGVSLSGSYLTAKSYQYPMIV